MWLESLRELGHSDKAIVLVFTPNYREPNTKWQQVVDLYPEAEFAFYKDQHEISKHLSVYIPILRPYSLWRYWQDHPDMKDKAVFYCDCDVVFTEKFNIDDYINDDVCYLSDTVSYIGAKYFDSKVNDVLSSKKSKYESIDVLEEITTSVGISRAIAEVRNDSSGGAQYLLKNIDAIFWEKMILDTIKIRTYLLSINGEYFENENKGFQSWCADMWALLWGLWYRGLTTKVISEMEFSWATDPIDKVERLGIFHNAGVVTDNSNGELFFYKGKYHHGVDPFTDLEHIQAVIDKSSNKGTGYYAKRLLKLKEKYNLNY
jgi:hypothetical protein